MRTVDAMRGRLAQNHGMSWVRFLCLFLCTYLYARLERPFENNDNISINFESFLLLPDKGEQEFVIVFFEKSSSFGDTAPPRYLPYTVNRQKYGIW